MSTIRNRNKASSSSSSTTTCTAAEGVTPSAPVGAAGAASPVDVYVKNDKDDNMDAPLSAKEILVLFTRCLIGPGVIDGSFLLLGAYIRTYPLPPTPWFGFYCLIGTVTMGYMLLAGGLLDKPRIIRERRKTKFALTKETQDEIQNESVAKGEKMFYISMFAVFLPSLMYVGYDGIENQMHMNGHTYNYIGAVLLLAGIGIVVWVLRTNAFASTMVYKQKGHRVIDSGPYGIVRHPMYGTAAITMMAMSLSAGSIYGIIPMNLLTVLLAIRTSHEEQFLIQTFEKEYTEYHRRVRYKMVPFIF